MFNKLLVPIKKIEDIVLTLFTKMKVFYQILIIIVLMIIFLTVQGYMGIKNINNMQEVVRKVFLVSEEGHAGINDIKNSLVTLRLAYLETLTNKMTSYIPLDLRFAYAQLDFMRSIDKDNTDSLEDKLNIITALVKEEKSDENYNQLCREISSAQTYVNALENNVKMASVKSMDVGNQFSANSRQITIIILVISTLISVGIGFLIAVSISRPLRDIINAANSLAVGNLSQNINAKGCREAVTVIKGLNNAVGGLKGLIYGIYESAADLAKSGQDLNSAAKQSGRSANEVAKAMEELAKASSEQTIQINQAVEKINILSDLVKRVSNDTDKISNVSEAVAGSAQLGKKATDDVANEFHELFNFTKEVAEVVDELHSTSEEISEITSVIQGIAEQTTLLALNASIEAARAGEHGKGFSVVAMETGKLAEQSKQAAGLIADLINQMKSGTERAVNVMQRGIDKAEEGKNMATAATATFEDIFRNLHDNLGQIEAMTRSVRQMADNNEEVVSVVSAMAAISEETMANTEEVSATAEEQSALAEQVTALAERLNQVAEKMRESVSVFRV